MTRIAVGQHERDVDDLHREYINVSLVQAHENFTDEPKRNDIAVILLEKKVSHAVMVFEKNICADDGSALGAIENWSQV